MRPYPAALLGGVCGTTVMTVALALEARLLPTSGSPVDYDASKYVVIAVNRLLGRTPPASHTERVLEFDAVHWGYGSAVAVGYEALRRGTGSEPIATALFYAGCQTMAFALFPLLGGTPPPWRWSPEELRSSITVHALYALTVAGVSRAARRPR